MSTIKKRNSLKDLGITLDALYENKKQIQILLSDKSYIFHVVLMDRKNVPDCKVSSMGANLWFRSNKGMKEERYKTLTTLENSLVKLIEKKVDTKGEITFGLCNEIYSF
jgi:hypothetical protein